MCVCVHVFMRVYMICICKLDVNLPNIVGDRELTHVVSLK